MEWAEGKADQNRRLIVTQLVVATVHIFALQRGRKRWHCRDCRKESAKKSDERSNKIKLVCYTGDAHRHVHWQTKLSGVTCIWLTNKTRIICLIRNRHVLFLETGEYHLHSVENARSIAIRKRRTIKPKCLWRARR